MNSKVRWNMLKGPWKFKKKLSWNNDTAWKGKSTDPGLSSRTTLKGHPSFRAPCVPAEIFLWTVSLLPLPSPIFLMLHGCCSQEYSSINLHICTHKRKINLRWQQARARNQGLFKNKHTSRFKCKLFYEEECEELRMPAKERHRKIIYHLF